MKFGYLSVAPILLFVGISDGASHWVVDMGVESSEYSYDLKDADPSAMRDHQMKSFAEYLARGIRGGELD